MATASIYVNPKLYDKHGNVSICIEVIHNRRSKRMTILKIKPREWDFIKLKVKHINPDHVALNNVILDKLKTVQASLEHIGNNDVIEIKKLLEPTSVSNCTLLFYLNKYYDTCLIASSVGYSDSVKVIINKIKDYCPALLCSEVTPEWFKMFIASFTRIKNGNEQKLASSTVYGHLKKIKYALKLAQKDQINIYSPFMDFTISVVKKKKRKLSKEHLIRLIELKLPSGSIIEKVKDFFLLQVYFRGMRVSDLLTLKPSNLANNRVDNEQRKTGADMSVFILKEAKEIIDKYKDFSEYYVMPFLKIPPNSEKREYHYEIKRKTALINNNLNVIAEMIEFPYKLSSHIARHSFAILMLKNGVEQQLISKMLGHTTYKETATYLDDLVEDDLLDDEIDKVFKSIRLIKP